MRRYTRKKGDKLNVIDEKLPLVYFIVQITPPTLHPFDDLLFNLRYLFSFLPKMSHLYSMFAKQVQAYCQGKTSGDASQCKKSMMLYGVTKLNEMEESHLDQMDPYQRNANNIRKCHLRLLLNTHQSMSKTFAKPTNTHVDEHKSDHLMIPQASSDEI
jgi:hypothetical protein